MKAWNNERTRSLSVTDAEAITTSSTGSATDLQLDFHRDSIEYYSDRVGSNWENTEIPLPVVRLPSACLAKAIWTWRKEEGWRDPVVSRFVRTKQQQQQGYWFHYAWWEKKGEGEGFGFETRCIVKRRVAVEKRTEGEKRGSWLMVSLCSAKVGLCMYSFVHGAHSGKWRWRFIFICIII